MNANCSIALVSFVLLFFAIEDANADRFDFNGDGMVGVADFNLLQDEMSGGGDDLNFDVNGDRAVDSADRQAFLLDVLLANFGDSNWDGVYDSADIVHVDQIGLYETGQPAIWQSGDWNGDGFYDSSDLIQAASSRMWEMPSRRSEPYPDLPDPRQLDTSDPMPFVLGSGPSTLNAITLIYNPADGSISYDRGGSNFTALELRSESGIFTGISPPGVQVFTPAKIFGGSGRLGPAAMSGLDESFLLNDLLFNGALLGGGDLRAAGGGGPYLWIDPDPPEPPVVSDEFKNLHSFSAMLMGYGASSGTTIYGTTQSLTPDANNVGTIWSFDASNNTFTKLHEFDRLANGLRLGVSGTTLFGTTPSGGANGGGTLWSFDTSSNALIKLHDFDRAVDGGGPGELVVSGTTLFGLSIAVDPDRPGMLWSFDTGTDTLTTLHRFSEFPNPIFNGIAVSGTTVFGTIGDPNSAKLWSFDTATNEFTELHQFVDEGFPGHITVSGTKIIGATAGDLSTGGAGTLWIFDTADNTMTNSHDFRPSIDGANPARGHLVWLGDKVYGTTFQGGPNNGGTLWSFAPLPGDFDANGALDVTDVNLLNGEIASETGNLIFDLNADMLVDAEDLQLWAKELRRTWFGDANLDGEFNSADLVAVFVAGKYEIDQEAGWDEGDWTGNRRFGSEDLVAAFRDGGYEQGPVPGISAIPEPTAILLLLFGTIGIAIRQRRFSF